MPEIIVPPGEPLAAASSRDRLAAALQLRRRDARAACSARCCSPKPGLLDGHEATTHWAYCDVLKRTAIRGSRCAQRALVVSGEGQRLVMAGGGTSWLDLALYLIARAVGIEAAMQVARINLIDWHHIGQQPFARLRARDKSRTA